MSQTASLGTALSSLRTTTHLLSSSLSILDEGTSDLPRLTRVLQQTRHFELLPSSTLQTAQESVLSELTPEIEGLIARVEAQVEKLERREQGVRARWELQEGRLGREPDGSALGRQRSSSGRQSADPNAGKQKPDVRHEIKARQLKAKKDRLSYAVERLTLQAQQTERKLRQSMAAEQVRMLRDQAQDPVSENDEASP